MKTGLYTMKLFVLLLTTLSLYGSMGSSTIVPTQEHIKFTFGNHKNHPVQKQEERRYLEGLASIKEKDIRTLLAQQGYAVSQVRLRDIASELVYEAYAADTAQQRLRIYLDPKNGSILKMEEVQ